MSCSANKYFIGATFSRIPKHIENAISTINTEMNKKCPGWKRADPDPLHMTIYNRGAYSINQFQTDDTGTCTQLLSKIAKMNFQTISSSNPQDYINWGRWVAFPLGYKSMAEVNLHISLFSINALTADCQNTLTDAIKSLNIVSGTFSGSQFKQLICSDGVRINYDCSSRDMNNFNDMPYTGLTRVYLGQGVNYQTGKLKDTFTTEKDMILCKDNSTVSCELIVQTSASEYFNFGEFDATNEHSGEASKKEGKAGISISYGLTKASLKSAFATQKASSSSFGAISKKAGLVLKQTFYLPYDSQGGTKEPNKADIERTQQALLQTSSYLKEAISDINTAYNNGNKLKFNLLVKDFYKEFGSHFISSVTRGQIGYYEAKLTFKGSQSESASSFSGETSFSTSGLFYSIGGTASYSQANSNTFSSERYSYRFATYASPSNKDTLESLDILATKIDGDVKAAKDQFDFKNLDPEQYKGLMHYPDLPAIPEPSDADKEKALDKWKAKWNKDTRITDLQRSFDKTNDYIKKAVGDDKYKSKEICTPYSTLNSVLEEIIQIGESVVLSQGDLRLISSSKIVQARLKANCGTIGGDFTHDQAITLQEELNNKQQSYKDVDQKNQEAEDAKNFLKWMQDVKYLEDKKEDQTFDQWYGKIIASDLPKYKKEWVDFYKDKGAITETISELIIDNSIGSKPSLKSANFTSSNVDEDYATLDYSIAPWSRVFTILDATLLDNYADAVVMALFQPLNSFLETRAYLKLAKNSIQDSASLNNWYVKDVDLAKSIDSLAQAIIDSYDNNLILNYKGTSYNLTDTNSTERFEQYVDNLLSGSTMIKEGANWYQAVSKLKELGLISPLGSLIAFSNGKLFDGFAVALNISNFYSMSSSSLTMKSVGEQIAISNSGNSIVNVIPILGKDAVIQKNTDPNIDTVVNYFYLSGSDSALSYGHLIPSKSGDTKICDIVPFQNMPHLLMLDLQNKSRQGDIFYNILPVAQKTDQDTCKHYFACNPEPFYSARECTFDYYNIFFTPVKVFNVPITQFTIESYKSTKSLDTSMSVRVFYDGGYSIIRQIADVYFNNQKALSSVVDTFDMPKVSLRHASDGWCLDGNNAKPSKGKGYVYLMPCQEGNPYQQFTPIILDQNRFTFKHVSDGWCLDGNNAKPSKGKGYLYLMPCQIGNPYQQFSSIESGQNKFSFKHVSDGWCLDGNNAKPSKGKGYVYLMPCQEGNPYQQFTLIYDVATVGKKAPPIVVDEKEPEGWVWGIITGSVCFVGLLAITAVVKYCCYKYKINSNADNPEYTDVQVLTTPIGISLDVNQDIEIVKFNESDVTFNYTDIPLKTSWIGPKDAILIYDHNNNEFVDGGNEIVLTTWSKNAGTDFEALLEVFDSNKDNIFDSQDDMFDQFYIWQDKNQNGVSEEGELTSLQDAGIRYIDFDTQSEGTEEMKSQGILNTAEVYWENGIVTKAYDLVFEHEI